MASQYAYTITLFDADRRKQGPKFEGVVSSTLKPLESQVSKVTQHASFWSLLCSCDSTQFFVGRSLCHHLLHGPRLHGPVCQPELHHQHEVAEGEGEEGEGVHGRVQQPTADSISWNKDSRARSRT